MIKQNTKQLSCTAVVTGKAVNQANGEGMQVPCTLDFERKKKKHIVFKNELGKVDK